MATVGSVAAGGAASAPNMSARCSPPGPGSVAAAAAAGAAAAESGESIKVGNGTACNSSPRAPGSAAVVPAGSAAAASGESTKAANGTARSSSPRAPGSAAAAAAGSAAAESGESTKPGNGKGDMPRPLVPPGVGGSRLIHVALQLHCPRLCGWPGASHVNKPTGPGSLSGVPLFFCIPWGQHRPRRAPFALRAYSGRVRHSERGRSTPGNPTSR